MMLEILLDGRLMTDRKAVHDLLAEKLMLPDYYGRNLDALYDLLSTYPERIDVTLIHTGQMLENLGNYGNSLLHTIQEAATENPKVDLTISSEII